MLKLVITCAFFLLTGVPFGATLSAQDETIASLKSENESLKSELETLKKEIEALKRENAKLKAMSGNSDEKTEKDSDEGSLIGKLWELDTLKPDGTVFSTVKFFAADGKVYFDSQEVGTYTERGTRVRLDITKNVGPRVIGTAELLRISNDPPLYQGRFTNKRGEKPVVKLRAIAD